MAGTPLMQALEACIAECGGDDVIFDRLAVGEKVKSIMDSFHNPETGQPFERTMLYKWIKHGGQERKDKMAEARKTAAHFIVEAAADDLEGTPINSASASLMKARADHKKWLAEKWNREAYGEQKAPLVELNIGLEHLEALRQGGMLPATVVPEENPAIEAGPDYEVLEGGKGSATLIEPTRDAGVPDQPSTAAAADTDDLSDLL